MEKIFFNTLKQNNYNFSFKPNILINFLFIMSYLFPFKNEILPSRLIFKTVYNNKYKNTIIFKSVKYLLFFLINIILFFKNKLFFYFKIYLIRN